MKTKVELVHGLQRRVAMKNKWKVDDLGLLVKTVIFQTIQLLIFVWHTILMYVESDRSNKWFFIA